MEKLKEFSPWTVYGHFSDKNNFMDCVVKM